MDSSPMANRPITDPGESLVDDIIPVPAAHGRPTLAGAAQSAGRDGAGRVGVPSEDHGPDWQPCPQGVTMSEEIEHPGPATSPFDVFLDRLPDDEPYRCARELMPYQGYAIWERMADALYRARTSCRA
jgi:hypothetical protein